MNRAGHDRWRAYKVEKSLAARRLLRLKARMSREQQEPMNGAEWRDGGDR